MKALAGIIAEHQKNAAEIMLGYEDAKAQIRAEAEPEEGRYLERLEPGQRYALMREQKQQRANQAHRDTLEAYTAEVERYHNELAQRRTHLKRHLFGVDGPDGAAALSRTVTASEGELAAYLDVAIQAENQDLARAVFVAAERRGAGDLMARYFDEVNPDARALYAEWSDLPTQDALERQRESVERIVQPPDPDRLMPTAKAAS
jgi:hypothetical protein